MSSMHDDDEQPLGSLLDEWGAQSAPEGFACAVVRASEAEKGVRSSRWAPRGVVIPLLLAALFVSMGAAAAFSQRAKGPARSGQQASVDVPVKTAKLSGVSFNFAGESGSAEPDPRAEPLQNEDIKTARPSVARRAAANPASLSQAEEVEAPVVIPPRNVHFPHCECGTSGVVCACSD